MLKKLKDMVEFISTFPKITLTLLAVLATVSYVTYTRLPSAISCTYQAMVEQSVPWDKWRYNVIPDKCQYHNGTRFIPLQKVMDVGAGEIDELE